MELRLRVLYDGWALAYQPARPAALHLWEILPFLPEEVIPILALPDEPPPWLNSSPAFVIQVIPQENSPAGRLRWEQRVLPHIAAELEADLLHLTHSHPPLRSGVPAVVSPTEAAEQHAKAGMSGRLRSSLGKGGMARAAGLLWPSDLPMPVRTVQFQTLPPIVHPAFFDSTLAGAPVAEGLDLPDRFILYHGSFGSDELRTLFEAWVWGAGALGESVPLLLLGAAAGEPGLGRLLERYQFGDAVRILPTLSPPAVSGLYQRASALIHPGLEAPWGGAVRRALACALPVVTTDNPITSALVGPAAFAISAGDSRKLGASLITVIVEEEVARKLSDAARLRASGWTGQEYRARLGEIYRRIAGRSG